MLKKAKISLQVVIKKNLSKNVTARIPASKAKRENRGLESTKSLTPKTSKNCLFLHLEISRLIFNININISTAAWAINKLNWKGLSKKSSSWW